MNLKVGDPFIYKLRFSPYDGKKGKILKIDGENPIVCIYNEDGEDIVRGLARWKNLQEIIKMNRNGANTKK